MAYGYVYPAPMPSPFWAPTSASIGRPTPPSSGATATDALDGLTASKDGDQEVQAEPLNRTWSERRPCLIAALIGLAFTLANAAMGGVVEPGTWFSFRQAKPLTFIGPFAWSTNATQTDAVWLHANEQPAVSFWLAANAICASGSGDARLILSARGKPGSDRAHPVRSASGVRSRHAPRPLSALNAQPCVGCARSPGCSSACSCSAHSPRRSSSPR